MKNSKLADEVLKTVHDGTFDRKDLMSRFNVTNEEIERCLADIMYSRPSWLHYGKGSLFVQPMEKHEVRVFLENGGFTTLFQSQQERIDREEYHQKLEIESWKAAVEQVAIAKEQALEARKSAKNANIVACVSIGIAALAALISLFKD